MWYNSLCNIPLIGCEPVTKKLNKFKNYMEFINWFAHLLEMATNRYEFTGLPDTMDERILLQAFVWYGAVTVFEKDNAIIALPSAPTNDFNLYGNPGYSWVWGANGYNERIKLELPNGKDAITTRGFDKNMGDTGTGIFIRETKTMRPFINYTISYAHEIADTMRTISLQRRHFKRPYVITAQEEVVNTVKKFFKDADENEEFIVGTGVFPVDKVGVVPITVTADEVQAMKDLVEWYLNQYRERCGIQNNENIDKKANLIADELHTNDEATEASVSQIVDYLNEQLEQVNTKFGLNIRAEVKNNGDKEEQEQSVFGDTDGETEGGLRGNIGE